MTPTNDDVSSNAGGLGGALLIIRQRGRRLRQLAEPAALEEEVRQTLRGGAGEETAEERRGGRGPGAGETYRIFRGPGLLHLENLQDLQGPRATASRHVGDVGTLSAILLAGGISFVFSVTLTLSRLCSALVEKCAASH